MSKSSRHRFGNLITMEMELKPKHVPIMHTKIIFRTSLLSGKDDHSWLLWSLARWPVIDSSVSLQRTSYLTQHRGGHSRHAVHGWPAVPLQVRRGPHFPGAVVVQPEPRLAGAPRAAPASCGGGQEPHGQPGQQQQRGLGQSGAPLPWGPEPRCQPRGRQLPVL